MSEKKLNDYDVALYILDRVLRLTGTAAALIGEICTRDLSYVGILHRKQKMIDTSKKLKELGDQVLLLSVEVQEAKEQMEQDYKRIRSGLPKVENKKARETGDADSSLRSE